MCLIHINEPTTGVNYCTAIMSLGTVFWKAEPSVYPMHDARLTKVTPLNGCLKAREASVTAPVWRLEGYKFTLHLMPITISHPYLLLALGFFSFLSSANHQWRTKEASSMSALLLQREVLCLTMQNSTTNIIRISASTGVPVRGLVAPPPLTSVRVGQCLGDDPSERPFFACC
jgi:hypothetical protein